MSTPKTTTATSNSYSAAGMNNYNNFQGSLASGLNAEVNNPLGNSAFNQNLAMAQGNAQAVSQRNISNSLANARTGGGLLSQSGAYNRTTAQNAMLAGSAMQSSAFNSSLNSALQNRQQGLAAMQNYTPLQTGATTTQQTSPGLMGYLGPLASAGLNAALPGIGSLLGGASFSDGYN